jgi:hypothetical protein
VWDNDGIQDWIWRDGERLSFNARFNALEAQLQTHVELSRVVSTLVSCMR